MAGPGERDAVLDTGLVDIHVLHDSQLKPSPGTGQAVVAVTLIVGFGEQLHAANPADGLRVEGRRPKPGLVDVVWPVGRPFVVFDERSDRVRPRLGARGVLGQGRQRSETGKV